MSEPLAQPPPVEDLPVEEPGNEQDWKERTDWPRPWMASFLSNLALIPNVTAASRSVGISRQAARKQRIQHPDFAHAWDQAVEEGVDNVERYAHEMSTTGIETVERIVDRKEALRDGKLVVIEQRTREVTRRYLSPHMAVAYLAAHRPEKWRRATRFEHTGADGAPIQTQQVPEEKLGNAVGELTARVASIADARRARDSAAGDGGGE